MSGESSTGILRRYFLVSPLGQLILVSPCWNIYVRWVHYGNTTYIFPVRPLGQLILVSPHGTLYVGWVLYGSTTYIYIQWVLSDRHRRIGWAFVMQGEEGSSKIVTEQIWAGLRTHWKYICSIPVPGSKGLTRFIYSNEDSPKSSDRRTHWIYHIYIYTYE